MARRLHCRHGAGAVRRSRGPKRCAIQDGDALNDCRVHPQTGLAAAQQSGRGSAHGYDRGLAET
eukprot:4167133-Pleurochrysis_carterae.AAC.1